MSVIYPNFPSKEIEADSNKKNGRTQKELEALKQLRNRLSDVLTPYDTDVILLKWLRAGNFNLQTCEKLFRKNETTKKVHKLYMLEEVFKTPDVIKKYEFTNLIGTAKDGTPIRYVAMGRGDIQGFLLSADTFEILKYASLCIKRDLQLCKENSIKFGREINEITFIVDMENFALKNVFSTPVVESGFDSFRMFQEHYPEIWKHIFVVNAPSYFYTAFNMFKPILQHTILQNIVVASKDNTPELLLKYIDANVLPAFLGGTRVDSNDSPMCEEFMKFGGEIPERYYLSNYSPSIEPGDKEVQDLWINPRSIYNYSFVVREPDSVVRLEIRTEKGSIMTYVLYRKFEGDSEIPNLPSCHENLDNANFVQLSPMARLQTHLSPLNNYFFAPYPGIYVYRLDNSANWFSNRRCMIRLQVLPPKTLRKNEKLCFRPDFKE